MDRDKHRLYLGNLLRDGQKSSRVIGYPGDGHMLTIGPTRSGKSRRLLIPNLLYEAERSFLVVDVKGELCAQTQRHRASEGSKVVALDPFGILPTRGVEIPTVSFNPLLRLEPSSDDFVDDAMGLAESLVQVNPKDSDPHWSESAQDLVAGLIMLLRCEFGDDATLSMLRQEISNSPEGLALVARQAMESAPHPAIRNKLAKFSEAADSKEIPSIMSNAQTQTRFLDSVGIARSLSATGIDFEDLKKMNMTIYLVLPPERVATHAKWLRLIISSAMTAMQKSLKVDGRPDVVFMLDEFPQLGKLQSVETAVSLNAGFGVKIWAAVQHLGQLKDHYGDNWETFLSAGCVTAFAPRDVFTREHLTKMIGTGPKEVRSTSRNLDGGGSVSTSVQKDELVSTEDWRQMRMGDQWAFIPATAERGQVVVQIHSVDLSQLPEVLDGSIRPGLG